MRTLKIKDAIKEALKHSQPANILLCIRTKDGTKSSFILDNFDYNSNILYIEENKKMLTLEKFIRECNGLDIDRFTQIRYMQLKNGRALKSADLMFDDLMYNKGTSTITLLTEIDSDNVVSVDEFFK